MMMRRVRVVVERRSDEGQLSCIVGWEESEEGVREYVQGARRGKLDGNIIVAELSHCGYLRAPI